VELLIQLQPQIPLTGDAASTVTGDTTLTGDAASTVTGDTTLTGGAATTVTGGDTTVTSGAADTNALSAVDQLLVSEYGYTNNGDGTVSPPVASTTLTTGAADTNALQLRSITTTCF
jgi:hypothetical protein